MSHFRALFLFVQLSVLVEICYLKTIPSENPVEVPLHVGAFNIQKLGNSKLGNVKIMNIVKKVLVRYDLVLVQEIVTTDESLMTSLVKELNKMVPASERYLMVISERLGRDRAKEQYAYIYKDKKLTFLEGKAYPDPDDEFMRPPYIVHFSTPTLKDMESLVAIGIHTQPKNAANETSALATVYDYAAKLYKQKNAILMGDMNAGCQNVRIGDWDSIELWRRKEFTWLISHDTDTTLSANCCPYDRIVIAGDGMADAVIWSSINVFNFKEAYGLTNEEALEISDHWPVEVKLRGKVSKVVENHLSATVCVTLDDSRKSSLPSEAKTQKSTLGFKIDKSSDTTTLSKSSTSRDQILSEFRKLSIKYPQLVSSELLASVEYKVKHGVLEDKSSHGDYKEYSHSVVIDFDMNSARTTIHFCAETSVN